MQINLEIVITIDSFLWPINNATGHCSMLLNRGYINLFKTKYKEIYTIKEKVERRKTSSLATNSNILPKQNSF